MTPLGVYVDEAQHFETTGELHPAEALVSYNWYLNNIVRPRPSRVMTLQERFNPKE